MGKDYAKLYQNKLDKDTERKAQEARAIERKAEARFYKLEREESLIPLKALERKAQARKDAAKLKKAANIETRHQLKLQPAQNLARKAGKVAGNISMRFKGQVRF